MRRESSSPKFAHQIGKIFRSLDMFCVLHSMYQCNDRGRALLSYSTEEPEAIVNIVVIIGRER